MCTVSPRESLSIERRDRGFCSLSTENRRRLHASGRIDGAGDANGTGGIRLPEHKRPEQGELFGRPSGAVRKEPSPTLVGQANGSIGPLCCGNKAARLVTRCEHPPRADGVRSQTKDASTITVISVPCTGAADRRALLQTILGDPIVRIRQSSCAPPADIHNKTMCDSTTLPLKVQIRKCYVRTEKSQTSK